MPLGPRRSQADSYGFARNAARIFFGRSIPAKASMVVGLYLSTSCCMSQPLQRRDGAVKCVDERLGVAAITVAPEGVTLPFPHIGSRRQFVSPGRSVENVIEDESE